LMHAMQSLPNAETQLATVRRHVLIPEHPLVMAIKKFEARKSCAALWQAGVDQSNAMAPKLSPLPMTARQALQMALSAQRCPQKSHAAVSLAMHWLTTLSKAILDGCVDPRHCLAATAPSPLLSLAKHDAHSGKDAHCCLGKVHEGKVDPPQVANKAFSSAGFVAVKAVHAGERNAASFVPLLVLASSSSAAACTAAKHCRQFVSAKHVYPTRRQTLTAIPYVSTHRLTSPGSCRAG
jgi:hypothetical protein